MWAATRVYIENGKPDQVGESNCAQYIYNQPDATCSCTVSLFVATQLLWLRMAEHKTKQCLFFFSFFLLLTITFLGFIHLLSHPSQHKLEHCCCCCNSSPKSTHTHARIQTHAYIHTWTNTHTHIRITGEHFRCGWCVLSSLITSSLCSVPSLWLAQVFVHRLRRAGHSLGPDPGRRWVSNC